VSDKHWDQDVWSVLMDDGTELLDVPIHQSDRNKWVVVAKKRGWTENNYAAYGVQFWIWSALKRRGDLGDMTFDYFLDHIQEWEKEEKPATADPTQLEPSDG
jgi:hypothetical protein